VGKSSVAIFRLLLICLEVLLAWWPPHLLEAMAAKQQCTLYSAVRWGCLVGHTRAVSLVLGQSCNGGRLCRSVLWNAFWSPVLSMVCLAVCVLYPQLKFSCLMLCEDVPLEPWRRGRM
jgi:hypothetical protein